MGVHSNEFEAWKLRSTFGMPPKGETLNWYCSPELIESGAAAAAVQWLVLATGWDGRTSEAKETPMPAAAPSRAPPVTRMVSAAVRKMRFEVIMTKDSVYAAETVTGIRSKLRKPEGTRIVPAGFVRNR